MLQIRIRLPCNLLPQLVHQNILGLLAPHELHDLVALAVRHEDGYLFALLGAHTGDFAAEGEVA